MKEAPLEEPLVANDNDETKVGRDKLQKVLDKLAPKIEGDR